MVAAALRGDGYAVFPEQAAVRQWAQAAYTVGQQVVAEGGELRHGDTWFVGVDALPNAPDGSIGGVPLGGTWRDHVDVPSVWHKAQLSVVLPGYPLQDSDESDAAHGYRVRRDAAHVDGLLPEGPDRRRHLREPHGFIAGLPLNNIAASPLVVWPGSQRIIRDAFALAFTDVAPENIGDQDVTEIYQNARRRVFDACERVTVTAKPGQVILLHPQLLHGVAPWGAAPASEGRMVAYFRPQVAPQAWLTPFGGAR